MLAASWYGPIAGWVALAFILFVPANHQCFGVTAPRGSTSGSFCTWTTGFSGSRTASLVVLAAVVSVVLAVQLVSSDRRFLVAVGVATTTLWIVTFVALLPNIHIVYWAELHGLEFDSARMETETLLMLPSGLLPLIGGTRYLRRQSREARAVS